MQSATLKTTVSKLFLLMFTLSQSPLAVADKGGSITVGEDSWTLVPAIQCSVYPGDIVNIAGHAKEDDSLEIVIDYGGPTGVRVGQGADAWHARKESIAVQIENKRVQGTATFIQHTGSEEHPGSFDVSCQ